MAAWRGSFTKRTRHSPPTKSTRASVSDMRHGPAVAPNPDTTALSQNEASPLAPGSPKAASSSIRPAGRRRSSAGRSAWSAGRALPASGARSGIGTRRADHRRDPGTPVDQRMTKGLRSVSAPPGNRDQSTSPVTVQPPGSGSASATKRRSSRLNPGSPAFPGASKVKSRVADSMCPPATLPESRNFASLEIRRRVARTVGPGSSIPARKRTPSIGTRSPWSRTSIRHRSVIGSRTVPSNGRAGTSGPTRSSPRNPRPSSVRSSTAVSPADRVRERPRYSSAPECTTSRSRPRPRRILGTTSRRARGGGPSGSAAGRRTATSTAPVASTVDILGRPVREKSIDARNCSTEPPFGKRTPSPLACERSPASEMLTRSVVVRPTRTRRASITIRPSTSRRSRASMATGRPVAAVPTYSAAERRSPGSRASQTSAAQRATRHPPMASSRFRRQPRIEGEAGSAVVEAAVPEPIPAPSGPCSASPAASGCLSPLTSALPRKSHQLSTADADLLAVTMRTPSSRFDSAQALVSATPSASFGPCALPQRHLRALATKAGEISGVPRIPVQRIIAPAWPVFPVAVRGASRVRLRLPA